MLLIYTSKVTPRLRYIFRHFFVRILNIPIKFTAVIEEFVAHEGLKMSYGKAPLGNELFVQSHGLLQKQGIEHIDIQINNWDHTPCFFKTGKKSVIPFDLFSASFYLLSRYEEYLPSVLDENKCFPATESLAYQNDFLEKPLIDIWAYKFLKILTLHHPEFSHTPPKYQYLSTFKINQTYRFKYKGTVRGFLGYVSDFFSFKFYRIWIRLTVLLKIKNDPYDTYSKILKLTKKYNVKTIFFFLISNYTTFDNNISYTKKKYQLLIKSIADYCKVGLLASYFTMEDEDLFKKENKRLSSIVNSPTKLSCHHLNRIKLPETYQKIMDQEIHEDFSMGYNDHLGFRASTCTPFYFYDLNFEIQTPIKLFPIAFSDYQLKFNLQLTPKQAILKVNHICNLVKQVNGTMVSVLHNECFSNYGQWKSWENFYEEILKRVQS